MDTEQQYIRSVARADMEARNIVNSIFSIEVLSNRPTHFDKDKGVKVKVFSHTIAGEICSANIMEGENTGKGTTCFLKNLSRI
jgi:hypothetical protein